ncbi:hypothetical protein LZC95_51560 [Pendulispora brunnea]|uniref:Uncharacterized protein n=1 Tax=Pendulispora brunnea TaxID=2905690 RepID=A0ABZ2K841_9BACT
MQKMKMGSWTACCALLISIMTAGCSAADPQDATGVDQNVESASQTSSCGAKADPTLAGPEESSTTVAEDGTVNVSAAVCKCCSDWRADAERVCAGSGRRVVGFYCRDACGLCGRDSAYRSYSVTCG